MTAIVETPHTFTDHTGRQVTYTRRTAVLSTGATVELSRDDSVTWSDDWAGVTAAYLAGELTAKHHGLSTYGATTLYVR
jgi:hypothetical protein